MCVNVLTCRCGGGSEWLKEKDEISFKFVSNSESCDYGSFLLRRKFVFFLKPLTSKVTSPQRHINTSTCVVNKHRLRLQLGTTTGAQDVLEPQVFFSFIESQKGPNDGLSVVWAVGIPFLLFIFYHPRQPFRYSVKAPHLSQRRHCVMAPGSDGPDIPTTQHWCLHPPGSDRPGRER